MSVYNFFERLIDPFADESAERPPTGTFKFIWHFIAPVKWVVFSTLLASGIAAVCELYLYAYMGYLVDWMAETDPKTFFETHGWSLVGMVIIAGIVRPLALLVSRSLINLALAPGIVSLTRWHNHRYVLGQSMSFFQNDFAGRVAQKVMQTGNAVREVVINVVDGVWLLVIYLVAIVAFLVDIKPVLLIPIGLWIVAYCSIIIWMVPPVRNKSASLSEATSALTGRVVDSYTNIQSVKLFAHHKLEEDFAGAGIRRHINAFFVLMRAILNMTVTMTVINSLLILGTAGLSIWLWSNNAITVGEVAIANGLIIRINQMSGWMLRTITSLFENFGTIENGIETISQTTDIVDVPNAPDLQVSSGAIDFTDISFQYADTHAKAHTATQPSAISKTQLPILQNCTINIAAGEKVGLVGRSGSGKSTLISLLMRFHNLEHGSICIDGQDIRQVTQASLRSNIGVVTQDSSLLHRSVRDNIRYGRAGASDEDIMQAAKRAAATDFIPGLIDTQGKVGLDATVGERGVKLSGGQRQRLAIARVILKDAPILILDEATSALDSEVESAIQEQLNELMEGKTVLAVAHRLSTIAALDRLIVLDNGHIVETGTHTQLLEQQGLYAQLWSRQSGGFLGVG